MSTRPRNPRYFPRMKVRGARRRRKAPIQLLVGRFDALNAAAQELARVANEAFAKLTPTLDPGERHTP